MHRAHSSRDLDNLNLRTLSPPQRLLFIITALGTGGAEMMLAQIVAGLDRARFEPHVIALVDGGKYAEILAAAGVPVHGLGMVAGRPTLRSLWRLRALAKQIAPSVIIGWMNHGNLAATLVSWLFHRAPVLWNIRQSLYSLALEKRGSALVIRLLRWLSLSPVRIMYNSAVSARQHEAIGYPAGKSVLVPNGFNTEAFAPSEEARASVRAELGLGGNALLVGRFGRASAMKDYPNFYEAMRTVEAVGVVAGTGTNNSRIPNSLNPNSRIPELGIPCDEHVLQSISEFGNSEFGFREFGNSGIRNSGIHELGERNDMPRLTAALDVAVSSSAFGEGFPNVVAEAMASGVPCVVTDVGDSAWLLGDTGKVVPARDAAALARAIAEVLAMPVAQRRALGLRARQRIVEDFSLPAVVAKFESIFHEAGAAQKNRNEQGAKQQCVA